MDYLNILHLSDLHLKVDEVERYNQTLVLEALLTSVAELVDGPYRPDLIVFSGDLVNSADENLFDDITALLELIAQAAELDVGRVILCAGNHDASRNAIGPSIPIIKRFRELAKSVDGANTVSLDKKFVSHVGSVFGSINTLHSPFGQPFEISGNFITRSYAFPRLGVGVVTVNSASLTGAGLTDDLKDERALFIPEMMLDRALKSLPQNTLKIVVGHHPLTYLNEENEVVIKSVLQKSAGWYMSGHLHRPTPEFVISPQGDTAYVQSGSLYARRDWWNGYGLLSIDPSNPRIQRIIYKKWYKERREFGTAAEFDDAGIVYLGEGSREHWAKVKPRLSARAWERWRVEKLCPSVQSECLRDLSGVFENERFLDPNFERDRYVETSQGLEKAAQPVAVPFDDAVKSMDNLVIYATPESGKTTLIREWARRMAALSAIEVDWRIPLILKSSEVKGYRAAIEKLVRQKLPDLPDGIDATSLLNSGRITFLVDDVLLPSVRDEGNLADMIKMYPRNRYVLLTSSVYLQGAGIAPIIVDGMTFGHMRAKSLRTSQVLALIESHGMKDPAQADRLLQRMMVEASSLNVPITPVTGTFLIQIYTEDNSTSLVNKANLLERYIEISLEKFAPAELLPSSFDFRNKKDLLSFVAERMARRDIYVANESDFISWVNEYLGEYGLRFSTIDLVNYFVEARILDRNDGSVAFRLNAFFEYFTAVRMSEDAEFKAYVLSEANYLRFGSEISFYAALSRKDVAWLDELLRRFQSTEASVMRDEVPPDSAAILESFVLPSQKATVADLRAMEDRAFNRPISEEERRAALDDDMPPIEYPQNLSERHAEPDIGHRWVAQLTMLSAMLKNMELVQSKRKSEILKVVLKGWLDFMAMSMRMVPILAEQRRLKMGGIEYTVLYSDDMDIGELAQRLYMYMPISTAKIANFHLGTEKLRVQLEDGVSGSEKERAASQFLRGAILAQLGVDGLPDILADVAEAISGKRYLQEVFFRLLAEVIVRFRLPESDRHKIKLIAADTRVQLEGASGFRAVRRKDSIMRALESSRLKVQAGERTHAIDHRRDR